MGWPYFNRRTNPDCGTYKLLRHINITSRRQAVELIFGSKPLCKRLLQGHTSVNYARGHDLARLARAGVDLPLLYANTRPPSRRPPAGAGRRHRKAGAAPAATSPAPTAAPRHVRRPGRPPPTQGRRSAEEAKPAEGRRPHPAAAMTHKCSN